MDEDEVVTYEDLVDHDMAWMEMEHDKHYGTDDAVAYQFEEH